MTARRVRAGGAAGAEHAHPALRRGADGPSEGFEAVRRVDVVAQDRLAGIDAAGEQALHAFPQRRFPERRVAADPSLDGVVEPTPGHAADTPALSVRRRTARLAACGSVAMTRR